MDGADGAATVATVDGAAAMVAGAADGADMDTMAKKTSSNLFIIHFLSTFVIISQLNKILIFFGMRKFSKITI